MMFHRSLCILAALANAETGMTAGQLVNRVGGYGCRMTKGQIENCLKHLLADKYVTVEAVKYRSNMDKKIYHIDSLAAHALAAIAGDYQSMSNQMILPLYQVNES